MVENRRTYQIHLKEQIDRNWTDWFEDTTQIRQEDGTSLLVAQLPDQSALMGMLFVLHNLGLEFISVSAQVEKHPPARKAGLLLQGI